MVGYMAAARLQPGCWVYYSISFDFFEFCPSGVVGMALAGWLAGWLPPWLAGWAGWLASWLAVRPGLAVTSRLYDLNL